MSSIHRCVLELVLMHKVKVTTLTAECNVISVTCWESISIVAMALRILCKIMAISADRFNYFFRHRCLSRNTVVASKNSRCLPVNFII